MSVEDKTVGDIVDELEKAAVALERSSNRLYHLTRNFEGYWHDVIDPETGALSKEWELGPNLRWRVAVSEAIEAIVEDKYSDTRAPAIERLERMAELRVRTEQPDLYAEYHRIKSDIEALKKWCSAKKDAISARQSVLKNEGVTVGVLGR